MPAVAVIGILAQAGVGNHGQLRHSGFDGAGGLLNDALVSVGLRALGVLVVWNTNGPYEIKNFKQLCGN